MMSCMLRIVAGVGSLICDGLRWLWLTLRSTSAVEPENLFLRRQLALYLERGVKPRRIGPCLDSTYIRPTQPLRRARSQPVTGI